MVKVKNTEQKVTEELNKKADPSLSKSEFYLPDCF